jgi:nucleoside-diphosphate-sugar epimerase
LKVLLTGANGFVGSHVLDNLRARGVPTAVLLRPSCDKGFIQPHLASVETRTGTITDPDSLRRAMAGVTHVIHCAGLTRARSKSEFFEVNQAGTRNVIEAANAQSDRVRRLLHVSSLAAIGPAGAAKPAREEDAPHPVSEYGKSKLAAELEVRSHCRAEFVIVRPPAVYGPRDNAFLSLFKAVNNHLLPRTSASQTLSLVFVADLAHAIVTCLDHPAAGGKAYFVASPEITTGRGMAQEIAAQIGHWTIPCPMPVALFWPVCVLGELWSRLTRKARMLNLQKFAELRAPGWVCDPSLLRREVGCECKTLLKEGVMHSLAWYREKGWL